MRFRASLIAALLLVVAAPAAVAPGAQAQGPTIPDIPPTTPSQTPWDAVRSGGYSSGNYDALAKRLGYKLDSQLAANSGLTQTQRRYAQSRLATAASKGRLIPTLRTVAPWLRLGATGTGVGIAGLIAYELIVSRNGETETQYYEFEQADLGGARVWVPGCVELPCASGSGFWRVLPDVSGSPRFGWHHSSGLLDASGAAFSGWVFEYGAEIAWGDKGPPECLSGPGCYPSWGHPNNKIPPFPSNGSPFMGETTPIAPCVASYTSCFANPFPDAHVTEGIQLATAAHMTAVELDGNLSPLLVITDTDANATGHVRAGSTCTHGFTAATCLVPYVREAEMERHAPRRVKEGPATAPEKTTTYTAPATTTQDDWDDITDELNDPCGKALFNHLAEPSKYGYYGCFEGEDPGNDPEPIPATLTLPKPTPNETSTAYRDRLRELGYLGTVTITTLSPALEGYGPLSPARVVLPDPAPQRVLDPNLWPNPGPVVGTDAPMTIRQNPETATEVPTQPPPPPTGSDDPATDCPCPIHALDFTPLAVDEVCDKAPFGAFCWIEDQISLLFGASAIAPAVAFNPAAITTPLGPLPADTFDFAIDLAELPASVEDFMDVTRIVLAFAVWLLGLWFMGRRMLQRNDTLDAEPPVKAEG